MYPAIEKMHNKLVYGLFLLGTCFQHAHAAAVNALVARQSSSENRTSGINYTYDVSQCKGYSLSNAQKSSTGMTADLYLKSNCTAFGRDIEHLTLNVSYETQHRLYVAIHDAAKEQWQLPDDLWPRASADSDNSWSSEGDLAFYYNSDPFEWWIVRKSNSDVIFDTRNSSLPIYSQVMSTDQFMTDSTSYHNNTALTAYPFVFEQQYIQVASALPQDANVYGLGEVVSTSGFRRNTSATLQPMWTADRGDSPDSNIYGSYPFYMEHRLNGSTANSHGVFLLSSEGMDVIMRDGVIEYRVVGGVLDFYFTSGPTPDAVIRQHVGTIGYPSLGPEFSLGFNLCRWGYNSTNQTREIVETMRAANIPLETMWNDIDHMHHYRDFTVDPINYPADEFKAFISYLHDNNQHYVPIIDAAINLELNSSDVYYPFSKGLAQDVFMKLPDGKTPYYGQVWPGATAFPDWFEENTQSWWTEAFKNFSEIVDFDGIWLDMNEVSSFCLGPCFNDPNYQGGLQNTTTPFPLPDQPGGFNPAYPEGYNATISGPSGNITVNGTLTYQPPSSGSSSAMRLKKRQNSDVNEGQTQLETTFPPYMLHNFQDFQNLGTHAVAPNATHKQGTIVELDVHNVWGYMEEIATFKTLLSLKPNKRPYIVSRSTFSGSGKYTYHWLGDNYSAWSEMRRSIQGILQFQMFGVPYVGSDACGFGSNTDEELCNRWMQLAAFTPFFRNHNTKTALPQEPFRWDSVANASRIAIAARYQLLPTLYSLMAQSAIDGSPAIRALFYEYPTNSALFNNSDQFMMGSSILVTPVLEPNVSSVTGAIPGDSSTTWYNWFTHESIPQNGDNVTLDAPLSTINVHVRSGSVLLLYDQPAYTVKETAQGGYALLAAISSANSTATGSAFVDDGSTYPVQFDEAAQFTFTLNNSTLNAKRSGSYQVPTSLKTITVLGVASQPSQVMFDSKSISNYTYDASLQRLVASGIDAGMNENFVFSWQ